MQLTCIDCVSLLNIEDQVSIFCDAYIVDAETACSTFRENDSFSELLKVRAHRLTRTGSMRATVNGELLNW